MTTKNVSLIVTAHPDDETIFFGGLVLSRPRTRWTVVCVTNGNADSQGGKRQKDCERACKALGVENLHFLDFPDIFEKRLDVRLLIEKLNGFSCDEIFTHGILGEYGHPHHQDVSYAVHSCFFSHSKVYSVAHNCLPELTIQLTDVDWRKKAKIYSECYFSETKRFIQMLPITFIEGFTRVTLAEVSAIYDHLTGKSSVSQHDLKIYYDLFPYFEEMAKSVDRPF